MSEFQINLGTAGEYFKSLNEFAQGYVEAMFFTEEENLHHASFDQLSAESLRRIVADCYNWQQENDQLLTDAYQSCNYIPIQAGRDYWFTSQGHGAGFLDRDLAIDLAQLLDKAARHSSRTLTWCDDVLYYE